MERAAIDRPARRARQSQVRAAVAGDKRRRRRQPKIAGKGVTSNGTKAYGKPMDFDPNDRAAIEAALQDRKNPDNPIARAVLARLQDCADRIGLGRILAHLKLISSVVTLSPSHRAMLSRTDPKISR
ncbi:MAG: hypothetical protein ACFCVA_01470 [Gammaproteobacteria bacterium]